MIPAAPLQPAPPSHHDIQPVAHAHLPLSEDESLRRQCMAWAFQTRDFCDQPHAQVLDAARSYYAFIRTTDAGMNAAQDTAPDAHGDDEVYQKVRGILVANGTTLNKWCAENGVSRQWATLALKGRRTGPGARRLVKRLLQCAGLPEADVGSVDGADAPSEHLDCIEARNAASVIDRIKETLSVSADNELAAALNMSKSTVATWRSRGKVPYSVAVNVAIERQVSLDWLLTGCCPTND